MITHVNDLSELQLVQILTEPKNALIKQMQYLFELDEIKLEFDKTSKLSIAKKAKALGTNARGLKNILDRVLLPFQFDSHEMKNKGVIIMSVREFIMLATILQQHILADSLNTLVLFKNKLALSHCCLMEFNICLLLQEHLPYLLHLLTPFSVVFCGAKVFLLSHRFSRHQCLSLVNSIFLISDSANGKWMIGLWTNTAPLTGYADGRDVHKRQEFCA